MEAKYYVHRKETETQYWSKHAFENAVSDSINNWVKPPKPQQVWSQLTIALDQFSNIWFSMSDTFLNSSFSWTEPITCKHTVGTSNSAYHSNLVPSTRSLFELLRIMMDLSPEMMLIK